MFSECGVNNIPREEKCSDFDDVDQEVDKLKFDEEVLEKDLSVGSVQPNKIQMRSSFPGIGSLIKGKETNNSVTKLKEEPTGNIGPNRTNSENFMDLL